MAALYVGSCRMNSGGVYRKTGSGGVFKKKKKIVLRNVSYPVGPRHTGRFPKEKGYFISTAGVIHSPSSHNG